MKIASAQFEGQQRIVVCADGQNRWRVLQARPTVDVNCVKTLIESAASIDDDFTFTQEVSGVDLKFLCPIRSPEKIICVGKNFADHAREMGGEKPELPVIFNKLPTCLIGFDDEIVLPGISSKVDYEAELVVVIGKSARNVQQADAMQHVFGFCIGNDVTARDWQKGRPGGQWLLGKAFDTFGPLGPYIVTADEIPDPHKLGIELKLNGEVMQSGNTSNLIFPIDFLISHISKFFTLNPGDLLFTGTPAGVGAGRTPEVYLKPGDTVEITISGLGNLRNHVVQ